MSDLSQAALQGLVDRAEIGQLIASHARGIDRKDSELLKSVYFEDATVDYGVFDGPAHDFCDILGQGQGESPVTLHRPTNTWIKLDGDKARAESYICAYMDNPGDDGHIQSLIGGRYLDSFERRDGEWKITNRTYVLDWNTNWAGTGTADEALERPFANYGAHGAQDPGNKLLDAWCAEIATGQNSDAGTVDLSADLAAKIETAIARQEIHELIMAQARAVDRGDEALLRSIYHPGATVDAGIIEGSAEEYCGVIIEATAGMKRVSHGIANEWITVEGDDAVAESYTLAFMTNSGDDGDVDEFVGGRYLDRFARREGVWKYTHRTFVFDWSTRHPCSDASNEGMMAELKTRGGRGHADPVYAFWGETPENMPGNDPAGEISSELAAKLEAAVARQDIHELIMAQARGVDRGDETLLRSVWHPGATMDAGIFEGPAEEFCSMIIGATAGMTSMAHTVANEWMKIEGDEAAAESYVIAFVTREDEDGNSVDEFTGGRYLDRLARKNGVWKCTNRTFVPDWSTIQPSSNASNEGALAELKTRGLRGPDDPVYAFRTS